MQRVCFFFLLKQPLFHLFSSSSLHFLTVLFEWMLGCFSFSPCSKNCKLGSTDNCSSLLFSFYSSVFCITPSNSSVFIDLFIIHQVVLSFIPVVFFSFLDLWIVDFLLSFISLVLSFSFLSFFSWCCRHIDKCSFKHVHLALGIVSLATNLLFSFCEKNTQG